MSHTIWINDKDIFGEFSLVPVTRPVVNEPSVIKTYVKIYGTDGPLDLSEALTGRPVYESRTGSWDFHIKNYKSSWDTICHHIANHLHGRRVTVRLEDDDQYFYRGRLELDKYAESPLIRINYTLEPYKYDIYSSLEDWLWDPFCFETDIIREYKDLVVPCELAIPGSARPCIPTITCSGAMTVTYKGTTYSLSAGDNRNVNILIGEDEETLTFAGSGTVSVDYRGGWL